MLNFFLVNNTQKFTQKATGYLEIVRCYSYIITKLMYFPIHIKKDVLASSVTNLNGLRRMTKKWLSKDNRLLNVKKKKYEQ